MFFNRIITGFFALHRNIAEGRNLFVFCFMTLLTGLLLGQIQSGVPVSSNLTDAYPSGDSYIPVLVQSRECEAPVLRSRLGHQLQINARTVRSNYQNRLQRNLSSSGFLPPEFCAEISSVFSEIQSGICKSSSYEVYSVFTSPVRAGPMYLA